MTWTDLGCTLLDSHPHAVRKLPGWKGLPPPCKGPKEPPLSLCFAVRLLSVSRESEWLKWGRACPALLAPVFTFWINTRQTSVSRKLEGCPSNQYALHPVHPSRSRAASQDRSAHSALSLCFSKFDSGPATRVTGHLGNEGSWARLVPLNQNLPLTWTPGDYVHILVETLDPQHSFCEGLCHPVEWAFLLSGPPGISSWGPGLRSLLLLDLQRHRGPRRAIENGWSDRWFLPKSLFNMAWWGVLRAHSIALGTTETQPAKVRQHLPLPWPPPSPGLGGYSANICWGKQAIITVGRFFTSTCWPTAQCAPVQHDGLSSRSGTCVPKKVPTTPSPATQISHLPNAGLWIFSWKVHLDSDFVKPGLRWSLPNKPWCKYGPGDRGFVWQNYSLPPGGSGLHVPTFCFRLPLAEPRSEGYRS